MIQLVDGESQLFLDDALSPILVAIWIGPATLDLAAKFHRWCGQYVESAKRDAKPVVMVSDGSMAGRPSADVRRAFAEQSYDPAVVFKSYVVITNPLVRGAMTAIGWLIGDKFDVVNCKTMTEALTQAAEYARGHGLNPPPQAAIDRYLERAAARTA